jgi:hypothetical protein
LPEGDEKSWAERLGDIGQWLRRGTRRRSTDEAPEEVSLLKLVLPEGDEKSWAERLGDAEFAHGERERPVKGSDEVLEEDPLLELAQLEPDKQG